MEGYIQTGIGIIVSVVLFFIGYRQTIGAKRERAKNANQSIHRVLLRRSVIEKYEPSNTDLTRLIEAKSREFQVNESDLYSNDQIVTNLFGEVFDSDLISPEQRSEIQARIEKYFRVPDQNVEEIANVRHSLIARSRSAAPDSIIRMVAIASMLGATATGFVGTFLQGFERQVAISVLTSLGASLVILGVVAIYRKNKLASESSDQNQYQFSKSFEVAVGKTIIKNGFSFDFSPLVNGSRPDFIVEIDGKKIAIETKDWDEHVPFRLVRRAIEDLRKTLDSPDIDRAILVTRKKPLTVFASTGNNKISIVPIEKLGDKLKSAA